MVRRKCSAASFFVALCPEAHSCFLPAGPPFSQASGFMNATTNFTLAKIRSEGADSGDVLKEARDSGHAEGEFLAPSTWRASLFIFTVSGPFSL